jgi:hypothetical protein
MKSLPSWLDRHAPSLQTLIAALMLVTLIQNCRTLSLTQRQFEQTQRQFESTIEPVLDYQITPDGILHINNQGSIPILNLELAGFISITFPDNRKLCAYSHTRSAIFTNQIDPAKSAKIDLSKQLLINPPKGPNSEEFHCLVFRYRRPADMKPFLRPVPFLTTSAPFYMALFPSPGTSFGGLTTQTPLAACRS